MIPEKFKKAGKSFVQRLSGDTDRGTLTSFCAFPRDVSFNGKDPGECIVLITRKSWAAFFPQYLLILLFVLSPLIFFLVLSGLGIEGSDVAIIGFSATIIFLLLAFGVAVDTFLKWYYSVNIITDQRVVDVDFNNVLYHRFSETQLEQIQDVTHKVAGLLGSLFDYGTVYIQTAGTLNEFDFEDVPRPRDVQDVLLDILEMKQKGQL